MKQYYVYILSSHKNGTLYVGVTSDLVKRVYKHKNSIIKSFTSKYSVGDLMHYEVFDNPEDAIKREKRLKKYTRQAKIELIEKANPDWNDLYESIL